MSQPDLATTADLETDSYRPAGFTTAEDAEAWVATGMSAASAYEWAQAGYEPGEAGKWWNAGVSTPATATGWESFGFTPATATPWTTLEESPSEAAELAESGVTAVQQGRRLGRETALEGPAADPIQPSQGITF